jgi:hypothetical protein
MLLLQVLRSSNGAIVMMGHSGNHRQNNRYYIN